MIFEGRDAAGKGGAIQRITEPLNPRAARSSRSPHPPTTRGASGTSSATSPTCPPAGEMVLFDRSWYNRAGVEWVMGFCTQEEYEEFLRAVPEFERMLVRSGIRLVKYWFSVSDTEQEKRFQERVRDPTKRWKLSPMDLEARNRWVDFSRAKDAMFAATDIPQAPWWVVEADVKKRARLNVITHLLARSRTRTSPRRRRRAPAPATRAPRLHPAAEGQPEPRSRRRPPDELRRRSGTGSS